MKNHRGIFRGGSFTISALDRSSVFKDDVALSGAFEVVIDGIADAADISGMFFRAETDALSAVVPFSGIADRIFEEEKIGSVAADADAIVAIILDYILL